MVAIVEDPTYRMMWRVYNIGITAKNKLSLVGAYGGSWEDIELSATCGRVAEDPAASATVNKHTYIGQGVANSMRQRVYSSTVILPNQRPRRGADQLNIREEAPGPDASEEEKLSYKERVRLSHERCIMHLEAGSFCHCGIWGYKSPARLQHDGYLSSRFWTGTGEMHDMEILCAVQIYGTVLEGIRGYRASDCTIEAMFVPAIPEAYIPVDPITLKVKPNPHRGYEPILTEAGGARNLKRLDPAAIYKKISAEYDCQIYAVPNGVDQVKMLSIQHPDPEGLMAYGA